jgi:hypothetical protein
MNELERIWNETVIAQSRYWLEGLRKTAKNVSQDDWPPG